LIPFGSEKPGFSIALQTDDFLYCAERFNDVRHAADDANLSPASFLLQLGERCAQAVAGE